MIRFFDVFFALIGLILLFPLFLVVYCMIKVESPGKGIYKQERIGKNHRPFYLYKFRSMYVNAESSGLLTVGSGDKRITKTGRIIRRFKIDELPQLVNIIKGDMSIVGPRPEVEKYVKLYTKEQQRVLSVRPGITDYASIKYMDENVLLSQAGDPESLYINKIMPDKIRLNMIYVDNQTLKEYFKIIFLTIFKIHRKNSH